MRVNVSGPSSRRCAGAPAFCRATPEDLDSTSSTECGAEWARRRPQEPCSDGVTKAGDSCGQRTHKARPSRTRFHPRRRRRGRCGTPSQAAPPTGEVEGPEGGEARGSVTTVRVRRLRTSQGRPLRGRTRSWRKGIIKDTSVASSLRSLSSNPLACLENCLTRSAKSTEVPPEKV